ncbi:MAG: ABC transporter substrate-binding protein [Rhodospirillales bacterium]
MRLRVLAILAAMAVALLPPLALAQKQGGVLRVQHRDSPGSMSIHEEGTISTVLPAMGVFNNLVLYDQHKPQNSMATIVPELATSWTWNKEYTALTFKLREGVTWHDGKPFTSADVKCTWEMLNGTAKEKFKVNNRSGWYFNLESISVNGPYEATMHLKRPQPAFVALLASGFTPVYPCHVSPRDMRVKPIGTGPFKFVEFKANESMKVERNPNYWKPGLPYLDGIEYTIITNRSTAMLSFVAGKFDMTFPYEVTVQLMKDVKTQYPEAVCEIDSDNVAANILMNPVPPFDNLALRKAVIMAVDRQAFIDILFEGKGDMGGAMMPLPDGAWGLPPDQLKDLPGFSPDIAKSREAAREIMRGLGYGPDKHLTVRLSTRNLPQYRDPSTILLSQLKEIWIDGELDPIETAIWVPKLIRREYQMALSLVGNGVDDPDQQFYENYVCGSRTYMGYCDKTIDALVDKQSAEPDQAKRRQIVWEIDRKLQQDVVRPMIYYIRGGTCHRPEVKGITMMVNSIFNGWRMEDVWLDR